MTLNPTSSKGSGGGGSGTVTSVASANTAISVASPTTAVVLTLATLDVIAADGPPAADWSNNSKKITSLANGSGAQDAAAFGQIPTALPPNGSAGGDLTGTYPNPTIGANKVTVAKLAAAVTLDAIATANATAADVVMNSHKITGLTNGSGAQDAAAFGQIPTTPGAVGAMPKLTPTAVKNSAYNAAAGDYVPVDVSGGTVTVTLPTAPADGTLIGVELVIAGGTNVVTVAAGGSDVFNVAGGVTTSTVRDLNQSRSFLYKSASAIWYEVFGSTPVPKITVFSANGTWTKSPSTKFVRVIAIGSGGGGGGGGQGAANCGGGGGGGGAVSQADFQISDISSPVTVTVDTGGAGGAAAGNGTDGQTSTFGTLLKAGGGGGGPAGAAANNSGGGGGSVVNSAAGTTAGAPSAASAIGGQAATGPSAGAGGNVSEWGGASGGGGNTGAAGRAGGSAIYGGAGGSGGGDTAGATAGGQAGTTQSYTNGGGATAGTGGGGAGQDGTFTGPYCGGGGSGGGGQSGAGTGGKGGKGSVGAGGGGGGASASGTAGAGGTGGAGRIIVFEW